MSQRLLDQSYQQKPPSFFFRHQHWRTFFCECVGTIILVMGVCCTIYKNPVASKKQQNTIMMHDLFVILTLYMGRCFFAPMTGGYFNTAVTLGVFFNKNSSNKISPKRFLVYVVAQLLGAFIGAALSKILYDASTGPFDSHIQYNMKDIVVRFVGEMIATMIFVHMVLVLTTEETTFINEECWVHLFVPIFLYGGRKISKYVDGLNPFELLALQFMMSLFTEDGQGIHVLYVLVLGIGELIGGIFAALFFNYVYYPTIVKWRNQE